MACLLSHTLKGIAITCWLLLFSTGVERADSCRPHCTGSYCVTVHRVKVDFKSADEICRRSRGELLWLQPHDDILHTLDYGGRGDFWIGLTLQDGTCTNLSAPLRGYEWTSTGRNSDFAAVNFWKDGAQVCSPHCVSTSSDLKWTERPCSQEIDGFLCMADHERACQVQELADYFRSAAGCSDAPCEHECTPVRDGYRCSCYKGYAPDSQDPRRCQIHCALEKCPPVCDAGSDSGCSCAEGYIFSEDMCEDYDECDMSNQCEQRCRNTYGSFRCSCDKGFVLKDRVKCVPSQEDGVYLDSTTPIVPASVKPASKNSTLKGSSLSTGGFIWLWICLAVLVIGFVCVVRWYALKRQKRMQQNSTQQSTVSQDINAQC